MPLFGGFHILVRWGKISEPSTVSSSELGIIIVFRQFPSGKIESYRTPIHAITACPAIYLNDAVSFQHKTWELQRMVFCCTGDSSN